jgi:hypothetical protein
MLGKFAAHRKAHTPQRGELQQHRTSRRCSTQLGLEWQASRRAGIFLKKSAAKLIAHRWHPGRRRSAAPWPADLPEHWESKIIVCPDLK